MRCHRIAPRFAFDKHSNRIDPLELSPEDWLTLASYPITTANEPSTTSVCVRDSDRFDLTNVQPSAGIDQRVLKRTHLCRAPCDACERSRYPLLSIVRPFLPHTTWTEAVEVIQHGGHALPTKTRDASILWLDIADFTGILHRYPLDRVLPALNAYLDTVTQPVYTHHGDVNKYLGDGFLSVFIKADAAVKAACEIQQATAGFNRRQSDRGELTFPSRVGIATGQIAIVSLGSDSRQDRTVLGTPVNIAKRLQEKAPPGPIWLSQTTFDRLHDPSGCHRIGPVEIKGLQEPVVVYEKHVAHDRH